jgi:hypothetical protein
MSTSPAEAPRRSTRLSGKVYTWEDDLPADDYKSDEDEDFNPEEEDEATREEFDSDEDNVVSEDESSDGDDNK